MGPSLLKRADPAVHAGPRALCTRARRRTARLPSRVCSRQQPSIAHPAVPVAAQAAAERISVLIFRKYMEAMHESMRSKDNRIMRLLRQLQEARAEAQILRLAPARDGDASDYDMYQARLAASDREQLRAKDRMLELYDEREEDSQRAVDQLHETVRFLTQRVDALLIVQVHRQWRSVSVVVALSLCCASFDTCCAGTQGPNLPLSAREELERVILAASATLPPDDQPADMLNREMGQSRGHTALDNLNEDEVRLGDGSGKGIRCTTHTPCSARPPPGARAACNAQFLSGAPTTLLSRSFASARWCYICTHICMYVCMHACMHACVCVCVYRSYASARPWTR